MKTIERTFCCLLLLLPIFAFMGCNNDDDSTPTNPIDLLPPATQTGENTMGYLVNGEPINVSNTSNLTAIYQQNQLQLGGGVDNEEIDVSIIITVGGPLIINMLYDLTYPNNVAIFVNNGEGCYYDYPNTLEGSLTITNFNQNNFIVSGTFEFSTVTEDCETVHITNGRFDMQYIP